MLDIKLKLTLGQANAIREAVETAMKIHHWNAQAVNATDEEKMESGQKLLECEQILRLLK